MKIGIPENGGQDKLTGRTKQLYLASDTYAEEALLTEIVKLVTTSGSRSVQFKDVDGTVLQFEYNNEWDT